MSKSVLFSRVSYDAPAKDNKAATYYRQFLTCQRMAKYHAAFSRQAQTLKGEVTHASIAAEYEYEATICALRLANNKEDSRHTLFAAMNAARAKAMRLKKELHELNQVLC
jgi:aminopeptidase C